MKGTRHNGRSGKDGVYNPLHNDRRFDPEHSEHIDNERVRQNIYWDCYQGYTTMADRGKEDNFSFNQIEMAYYVDHYSDYVINQNKRHEKARHPDRCKGVEDVLKNKKTCPEESIYQLGTIDVETVLTAPATCIALPIFFAVSLSLSLRNRPTACDAKAADTSLE